MMKSEENQGLGLKSGRGGAKTKGGRQQATSIRAFFDGGAPEFI
jgi:hypothetical protein